MNHGPRSFAEFWPHYLRAHSNRTCRIFHYVGSLTGLACVLASVFNPWLIPIGLASAYGMAWTGHFLFERNRPASWHSPKHFYWSFLADWKMLALMLTGQLRREQQRHPTTAPRNRSHPTRADGHRD